MKFWLQTQMLIRVSVFPHHCQPEDNLRHGKTLHASSFPRNLSRDASPRRPGQCIWVLDDPIVRGKRFRLQCRAPKENLRVPNLLSCLVYPGIRWPYDNLRCLKLNCTIPRFGEAIWSPTVQAWSSVATGSTQEQWLAPALRADREEAPLGGGTGRGFGQGEGFGGREAAWICVDLFLFCPYKSNW